MEGTWTSPCVCVWGRGLNGGLTTVHSSSVGTLLLLWPISMSPREAPWKTKCLRDVSYSQSQVPIHLGNPILLPTDLGTCATEHRAVRGGGGWLVMFVRSRWLTKINSCFVTTHCTLTYLLSMLRVYQQLLFRTRYYYKHGGQCACREMWRLCSILTTPCSWPRPGPENWSDR